jgi:hypothetical protein
MTAPSKKPFLAVVDGEAVPQPARIARNRRPRRTAAEREATAIAAAETLENLLPIYVEAHRVWANGCNAANKFRDANVPEADRFKPDSESSIRDAIKPFGRTAARMLHRPQ